MTESGAIVLVEGSAIFSLSQFNSNYSRLINQPVVKR